MIIIEKKKWYESLKIRKFLKKIKIEKKISVIRINGKLISKPCFCLSLIKNNSEIFLIPMISGG